MSAVLLIALAAAVGLFVSMAHGNWAQGIAADSSPAATVSQSGPSGSQSSTPTIEVFVRDGCTHCTDAKAFLAQLQHDRADIVVRLYPVDTDTAARDRLTALFQAAGEWPPGVPTFVAGNRMLIGFDDAEHRGASCWPCSTQRRPHLTPPCKVRALGA